jgi:hypothetical protein
MTEPRDAAEEAAAVSPVFTPDDEPYRGRPALFHFDQVLIVLAAEQSRIGPWTRTHELTALQRAAGELVPGACSVAFSVRELVRQGYLLAAMILIRPLVERVSTLAYLIDHEDAVSLWQAGWPHGSRPGLATRLKTIGGPGNPVDTDIQQSLDELRQTYNSLIHGDPQSALTSAVLLSDGAAGYTISKDLTSPARADDICRQASTYAMVLTVRCAEIFPRET